MKVGPRKTVVFDYRLYDEEGILIDYSGEDNPLSFVFGEGTIIPGLESQMEGMEPGEDKEVIVPPEDAYGPRDPGLIQQVPRARFSGEAQLETGTYYVAKTDTGQMINFMILGMDDDNVEIDMNHPLAGKTLRFEVKVKEVQEEEQ